MMADSSRSTLSKRVQDFLPSVKPSYISLISVFLCGILWLKNDATNERLSMLETTSLREIHERGGFANGHAQEMSLRSMAESRASPFERKSHQDVSKTLHYSLGKNVLVTWVCSMSTPNLLCRWTWIPFIYVSSRATTHLFSWARDNRDFRRGPR